MAIFASIRKSSSYKVPKLGYKNLGGWKTTKNHCFLTVCQGWSLNCTIPAIIRGAWFSWENRNILTELDPTTMTNRGTCIDIRDDYHVNYTMVFHRQSENCFICVKILVRTVNVLETMESALFLPLVECTQFESSILQVLASLCLTIRSQQSRGFANSWTLTSN